MVGAQAFDGQQAVEVMMRHLNDPVPPMSRDGVMVPEILEQLVLRCLAKKASERPASMGDVVTGLTRARGELGGIFSGNIAIPEDVRERLRSELLSSPLVSGPHPVPVAPPGESTASRAVPAPATPPRAPTIREASSASRSCWCWCWRCCWCWWLW